MLQKPGSKLLLLDFAVAISVAFASKQAGAPFTLNNLVAACIATELLQLLSLGR